MDSLREQVARAHGRMVTEQLAGRLVWCVLVSLAVAAVAIAVPRLLVIENLPDGWDIWWLLGGVAAGPLAAVLWTLRSRRSEFDAAAEIDRRFGLRERVASCVALSDDERASEFGRALEADAERAVRRIDVGERFHLRLSRRAWLPLLPAVLVFLLVALLDHRRAESSGAAPADVTEQVQQAVDVAREEITRQQQLADQLDLPEAAELFTQIERRTRELAERDHVDRTEAAVELNDLAKQLAERQQQLGGEDGLRKQFEGMESLGAGPAERAARAMKQGDFAAAAEETEKLAQDIRDGKLDESQREQLGEQLDKMREKTAAVADAHRQAREDLQQQIAGQRRQGNLTEAGELQQQLEGLQAQQPHIERLEQFGLQLGTAQQGLQQGNMNQSAEAMSNVSQQLGQMQQANQEMQMLETAQQQLAQAKSSMSCPQCGGKGCSNCARPGAEGRPGSADSVDGGPPGAGFGSTPGGDPLTAQPTEGDFGYQPSSRVRGQLGEGAGVVGGLVDGPLVKGEVLQAIKQEMAGAASGPVDPLPGELLPPQRREHAEQYFQQLRDRP